MPCDKAMILDVRNEKKGDMKKESKTETTLGREK